MNGDNMHKIFIDGREGTTGLQIERRLAAHENLTLLTLPDALRKDPAARKERMAESDITVLCLPDEAAKEAVSFAPKGVRIADASTAHRTAPGWAYGFPELGASFRNAIATGDRVAVPGCHASGFIALTYPLVQAGVLSKASPLSCFSLTGYSGGGKKMIADYENSANAEAYAAPRPYALGQTHKHLPEMTAVTELQHAPVFMPVVCNYYSGMAVSIPLHMDMLHGVHAAKNLADLLADYYQTPGGLVEVAPYGEGPAASGTLSANLLQNTNRMLLSVTGEGERVLLTAVYDNLGKGASGAAVQCINLMLGLPEATGLI